MSDTDSETIEAKSVGSFLRETREKRGMSLDEAARITRIGKNYLTAMEADMFDKLPSAAYIKGFLRIYAGCLGIQGDEIIAMYLKDTARRQLHYTLLFRSGCPEKGGSKPANAQLADILYIVLGISTFEFHQLFTAGSL